MAHSTFPHPNTATQAIFGSPSWTYSGPSATTGADQPAGAVECGQDEGPAKQAAEESTDLAHHMERSLTISLPYRDQEALGPPAKAAHGGNANHNTEHNNGEKKNNAPKRPRHASQKGMRKLSNMLRQTLLTPDEGRSAEPPAAGDPATPTPNPRPKRPRRKREKYSYTMSLNLTPQTNDQGSTGQYFAVLLGQETTYKQLLDRALDALAAEGIVSDGGPINMAFAIPTVWEREDGHPGPAPCYYGFASTKEMRFMRNECRKYHGATRLEVHVSVERFPAARLGGSRNGRGGGKKRKGKKKMGVVEGGGGEVELNY
ncbi:hypothetical protein DFP73DRAFT_592875 [Morchella snyderi]|nr:hypothetical protein DFP73DRAFT_592875 [Morchella snyderi]